MHSASLFQSILNLATVAETKAVTLGLATKPHTQFATSLNHEFMRWSYLKRAIYRECRVIQYRSFFFKVVKNSSLQVGSEDEHCAIYFIYFEATTSLSLNLLP